jgi:hypothetical protein
LYNEAAQLSREYSSWISPSSAGWGLSGSPYAFYAVFIAEETDGIWRKGPEHTKIVDTQTLLEAFLKCPWDLPVSLMRFFFLVQYNYVFLLLCLCILIVMYVLFCIFCFIVPTGTLPLSWLRFSHAFSSVVRQMPRYNSQRRGTARTLPN